MSLYFKLSTEQDLMAFESESMGFEENKGQVMPTKRTIKTAIITLLFIVKLKSRLKLGVFKHLG